MWCFPPSPGSVRLSGLAALVVAAISCSLALCSQVPELVSLSLQLQLPLLLLTSLRVLVTVVLVLNLPPAAPQPGPDLLGCQLGVESRHLDLSLALPPLLGAQRGGAEHSLGVTQHGGVGGSAGRDISRLLNSDVTPALLCHKEPARETRSPLIGAFLVGSL